MNTTLKKHAPVTGLRILLCAFFLISVILPLFKMLLNLGSADFAGFVSTPRFQGAVVTSLLTAGVSMVISVALAMVLAWCITRSGIRLKGFWVLIFTLPMLIPSISHGIGLIILFGSNGVITNLLGLSSDIYGFWGIVTGSVIYSFPVAFLMIYDVLRYEDGSQYEAADVLGIPKRRQFLAITLPYLRKPLISVFFSTFTLVVTDYGVPLMVGTHETLTLPVMMYQEVIEMQDFGKGSIIGLILLVPAFAAFVIDLLNRDRGAASFVTKRFEVKKGRLRDAAAYLICGLTAVFVLLPVVAFGIISFAEKYPINMTLSFRHVLRSLDAGAGQYLANSLIIALSVAVIGVILSTVTAYVTARLPSRFSGLLHLISITSLAVPGLVLGLSYVLLFNSSFIYGTMAILIMVNIVHFFASPYLMMYNSMNKLNPNLEPVGQTLGVGRFRIFLDVVLPQSRSTLIEMFTYFFVNSMMTISAVSFLATSETRPLSLMITIFENTMMRESMAFISLVILGVNLIIRLTANLIKGRSEKLSGRA